MDHAVSHRSATLADAPLLAELNRQLIEDEGHRNAMSLAELEGRMRGMLSGRYVASLFARNSGPIAYALWRDEQEHIYLRQFFVARAYRRAGIGRQAVRLLKDEVWPAGKRVRVEVLVGNAVGLSFWRSVGFCDYCMTLSR